MDNLFSQVYGEKNSKSVNIW